MTGLAEHDVDETPDVELVTRVADNFVELMRTFVRARQTMVQAAQHDVEWTSHIILRTVKHHGPMRAGELAEHLQSDPSTISRQVATVVKEGLLERQADPDDGRASLLVLTDRADVVLADYDQLRIGYFARMLSDWTDSDLQQFGSLLDRFTETYQSFQNDWITEKIGAAAGRTRSNT